VYLIPSKAVSGLLIVLHERIKGISIHESPTYSVEKIEIISQMLLQSITLLALGVLASLFILKGAGTRQKKLVILGLLLVVLELFYSVRGNFIFVPKSALTPDQRVVDFLKEHAKEGRIASTGDIEPYTGMWLYFNHLWTRPPFSKGSVSNEETRTWSRLKQEINMFPANLHLLYNLRAATGYVALLPSRYRSFASSEKVNSVDFRTHTNPLLNEISTQYLISGFPLDVVGENSTNSFTKEFSAGQIAIYKHSQAKPRLELVEEEKPSTSQISVIKDSSNEIKLTVNAQHPVKLIIRDLWYPGWRAKVNDHPVEIAIYNEIFRMIPVPKGESDVQLRYQPQSFRMGALITFLSLCITGVVSYSHSKAKRT